MFYVYIAGPYSNGDVLENVRTAMDVGDAVLKTGAVPFIPHLYHFWDEHSPKSYQAWLELDLKWLSHCDLVYRISGYSPGTDVEEAKANELGIPIVRSIEELNQILGNRNKEAAL